MSQMHLTIDRAMAYEDVKKILDTLEELGFEITICGFNQAVLTPKNVSSSEARKK